MPAIRSLTDEPLQTTQQWTLDSTCCSQWSLRGNHTARKHNILCTCCLAYQWSPCLAAPAYNESLKWTLDGRVAQNVEGHVM